MRPQHLLILLLALLALGGTLFFMADRRSDSERDLAGAPARTETPSRTGAETTALEPAKEPAPEPAGTARTTIEAPPVAPVAGSKAPLNAALAGRVVDGSGQPIAGAEVRARSGEPDFADMEELGALRADRERTQATTDAAGRFEIRGVKPGSVRVSVRAKGFVPLNKPAVGVPAVERHELGDLALETSVILEGRVVDSRGNGVEGARLERANADGVMVFGNLDDPTEGPPALAVTGADGSFRIDELATGPWRLRITSETHPDKSESGATRHPGEQVSGLSFALEDGFEIAGRVTGVPAASANDVSVVAMPASAQGELSLPGMDDGPFGENRRRAKLAIDGSFVVRGLKQGSYNLQARVKSGKLSFWPRSASERVEAKSGDRGVTIAWQPASVLAFQVVDAKSKAPIEMLQVSARMRASMEFFDASQQESRRYESGQVQVDDLRPRDANDRATLDVSATGYRSLHRSDIVLARGAQTDLGVLELERATTVAVHVIDLATRAPIANARVTLSAASDEDGPNQGFRMRAVAAKLDNGDVDFSGGDASMARTDADGFARLNSLPGKRGKLSVSIDGYAPYSSEAFEMPLDQDVEQTVALDQGGAVEITLLAADGTPVSGARIEHRAPDAEQGGFPGIGGPFGRGKGAATDANGKVTLANLAPGVHRFRPAKSGGGPDTEEAGLVFSLAGMEGGGTEWSDVNVVRGTTATLVLREPERAELKGRVREGGSALAGASILLKKRGDGDPRFEGMDELPFGGGGGMRTKSDGEGRYHFEKVDAGSYELVVRHATRSMPARFPVEVDAGGLTYDIELPISILEGRVTDGEHKPVAGARVWAERKPAEGQRERRMISIVAASDEGGGMVFDSSAGLDASRSATDENGRYSLRGVENDVDLVVRVEAKDCEPTRSEPVSVALGQTKTGVDVEVNAAGQIKAKILAAADKSSAPCMVHAEYLDSQPEGKPIQPKVEFAQGGSVTLKGLRPGRWKLYTDPLSFGADGAEHTNGAAREVLVVAHETAQVELPLP